MAAWAFLFIGGGEIARSWSGAARLEPVFGKRDVFSGDISYLFEWSCAPTPDTYHRLR
jgi:hypothetical protein